MATKLMNRVDAYAAAVRSGAIPSCQMVRLAIDRWYRDCERADLYFDEGAVAAYVRSTAALRQYKGKFAGRPLRLEDWQLFISANIFGWKYRATGLRRFKYADVYVPRKNGKTTYAASIANFMLLFDGEAAAEVYAAAVDKEQAKICFDTAKNLFRGSPLEELVTCYRGSIVDVETASSFKPLTKDTKNKDGLNPHCAVCDERHAWKTNEIYEVIKTGMGARTQPLVFSISTAGTDTSVPYFEDLEYMRQVMLGKVEQDNHFVMLYEPDEGDQWDDPVTWAKVNPNLGVSLSLTYMEDECREAKNKGGTTLAAFQTKNLNMWVDAPDTWIADADVLANAHGVEADQLCGKECWVGIDLAAKTDITAVAFWFPEFEAMRWLFVIPEEKLTSGRGDRVDYRRWAEEGWIDICPGKVLDEDWFMARLLKELTKYKVMGVMYDPWGMWNLLDRFGSFKGKLVEWQQGIRNMSVPTKWLETAVLQHRLDFGGNPVIRWMFGNVVIYRDSNGNIKLDKARSRNKIDGVVAAVDAIGGWLNATAGKASKQVYTDHDLRILPNL